MLTIAILINDLQIIYTISAVALISFFFLLLAALHGRPESKGTGHALNALYVGTPLGVCLLHLLSENIFPVLRSN